MEVHTENEIRFATRVACEDDDENNWDFLYFSIDGTELQRWDGQVDWREESYPVSIGVHTFSWTYSKDGSVSHYADAGWIDFIQLPWEPDISDIVPGDVNMDGVVNVMDVVTTVNFILNVFEPDYEQLIAADLDGNGAINVLDLIAMVNLILAE